MAIETQSPFDPRLLRRAKSVRRYFVQGALIALLHTGIIIAFSLLIAQLITRILDGANLQELTPLMMWFLGTVLMRFILSWLSELVALRGASALKSQFRQELLNAAERIGPEELSANSAADLLTLMGQGLDSLDAYFSKFLPQLIATAVTTPVLVAVLLWQDIFTGIAVIVSIPLIPVFMALIGWATEKVQLKQWQALTELSRSFLELMSGLATLKIFRRQYRQSTRLKNITEEYRNRTMKVLRISFVSSFVLELAASLSLAIVAVSIGLRLLDGTMLLAIGLFVLLLTPEAYLPIRQVGAQYHASAEGVAAVNDVFALLERAEQYPEPIHPIRIQTQLQQRACADLEFDRIGIRRGNRELLKDFSTTIFAGKLTVIIGPSGTGKTSLFAAILGFIPHSGIIRLGSMELGAQYPEHQHRIAWSPQRAKLFAGTVEENITYSELFDRAIDHDALATALQRAAVSETALERTLEAAGQGLSGGQAQRVSLARSYYALLVEHRQVLLCDEPTSALDEVTEQLVLTGLKQFAAEGFTVVVISHREAVTEVADQVINLTDIQPEPVAHSERAEEQ